MITDLILPKFNMDMESAVLIHWLRGEGERVTAGDPVAEVSTDKVNMEVEATADGILFDLRYAEGDTVPVSVPIARIASDESEIARVRGGRAVEASVAGQPSGPGEGGGPPTGTVARPTSHGEGRSAALPDHDTAPAQAPTPSPASGVAPTGRIRATPAARRLARELGLDLATIASDDRRISLDRVRLAAGTLRPTRDAGLVAPPGELEEAPKSPPGPSAVPARAGASSSPELAVAGVWTSIRVDAKFPDPGQGWPALLSGSAWVFLVARALRDHPRLNASYRRGVAVVNPAIHVCLESPGPAGLTSTLVCDADRRTLLQIDREIRRTARAERLGSDGAERCEATFTIVDLSEIDVDGVLPTLRAPQAATLGIGRRLPHVVAAGEGLRIEPRVQLALSFDPRVLDEAAAGAFLVTLGRLASTPGIVEMSLRASRSVQPSGADAS